MNIKGAITIGVFGIVASTAGAKAQTIAQATLIAPTDQRTVIVINDRPWRCDRQTCSGPFAADRFDDPQSCRDLAQKVGAVATYQGNRGNMTADDLTRCNKYARSSH